MQAKRISLWLKHYSLYQATKDIDDLKKSIVQGINYIKDIQYEERNQTFIQGAFDLISTIEDSIEKLTLKEFMGMYPIAKEYDGSKYDTKDYFSTMKAIKDIPLDKPIGESMQGIRLLSDYNNYNIIMFLVSMTCIISRLRQFDGKPGILEEWCEKEGVQLSRLHTDEQGKQFVVDGDGRSYGVKEKSHLRVIKGGN